MLLEIAPVADGETLPACTPSLMPFHISYTGPAPISRYFRPRPARGRPSLATLSLRSSSTATVVASSSSTSTLSETQSSLVTMSSTTSVGSLVHGNECGDDAVDVAAQATATRPPTNTATEMDLETQPASDAALGSSKSSSAHTSAFRNDERFVAAFRGRQIYGQAVDVPSGYGGLVLRTPIGSEGKDRGGAEIPKLTLNSRAATRRPGRAMGQCKGRDGSEPGGDSSDVDIDPPPPTRTLTPSSTFSSFMVWTPDRPLDEGRDEYVRALAEWTRLATEIHSYDE